MINKKSWKEFQNSGLLWAVNTFLHMFGWAIVVEVESDGRITDTYPARVKFRGFPHDTQVEGFKNLARYVNDNAAELEREVNEG